MGYDFIWFKFIQLFIQYTKTSKSVFYELFYGKNGGLLKMIKSVVEYAKEKVLKSWENVEEGKEVFSYDGQFWGW